jgi:hypothetical protein
VGLKLQRETFCVDTIFRTVSREGATIAPEVTSRSRDVNK